VGRIERGQLNLDFGRLSKECAFGQRMLIIGVAYFVTLFEAMANTSQLPPLIAAWSPDLIFGLAGGI